MKLNNRYDFVFVFDVQDGNPNGDPDAGNLPRIDAETGMGLVTDVCLKRKVRNYVQLAHGTKNGYDIFIKEKAILNNLIEEAHNTEKVKSQPKEKKTAAARQVMCEKYFDIRTFGAVMTTGENAGQVRGPIQLTFSRSVDPITTLEHSITRVAITRKEDANKAAEMGRKSTVPYGLYVCHGFISAKLAEQTGFSEEDLNIFWEALKTMFDIDRSAARGLMSARRLIVFKHDSELGNAAANKLFDLVNISRTTPAIAPRCYNDYSINIDREGIPEGVKVLELI